MNLWHILTNTINWTTGHGKVEPSQNTHCTIPGQKKKGKKAENYVQKMKQLIHNQLIDKKLESKVYIKFIKRICFKLKSSNKKNQTVKSVIGNQLFLPR